MSRDAPQATTIMVQKSKGVYCRDGAIESGIRGPSYNCPARIASNVKAVKHAGMKNSPQIAFRLWLTKSSEMKASSRPVSRPAIPTLTNQDFAIGLTVVISRPLEATGLAMILIQSKPTS